MISLIILFIVLSSGSFFVSTYFEKRYEEMLPLTLLLIVFVIYITGIFGFLKQGVYIVSIISLTLYITAIIHIIKNKIFLKVCKKILTPASFMFLCFFLLFAFCDVEKLAYVWDEFSHWADVVKSMYLINDFGANPLAHVSFVSYPPAMSIFQYFVQVMNDIVKGTSEFSEWRLFFAYSIFSISLFMPFLKKLEFKNTIQIIVVGVTVFLVPMLFFSEIYSSIYIDPFLGLLFGYSLATLFVNKSYGIINILEVVMSIFTLVLVKDAGQMFSIITAAIFIMNTLFFNSVPCKGENKSQLLRKLFISIIGVLSFLFAKYTWQFVLEKYANPIAFSKKLVVGDFLKILTGKITDYRSTVLGNYFSALFTKAFDFEFISMSAIQTIIILICSFYFLISLVKKHEILFNKKGCKCVVAFSIIALILYSLGLIITYINNFSEYEALALASYQRYINIIFQAMLAFVFMSFIYILLQTKSYNKVAVILFAILIMCSPKQNIYSYLLRKNVDESKQGRAPYTQITDCTNKLIDKENAHIYFISQADMGYDYWVYRYSMKPYIVNQFAWSLGEPYFEGDIWTKNVTADEWQDTLRKESDYVVLYKLNDRFTELYGGVFENSNEIKEKQVYKVNKQTGKLTLLSSIY